MELQLQNHHGDNSDQEKEIKPPQRYPRGVLLIVATELSERFSYYGMRAVLTVYMTSELGFSEDKSTTLYHTFLLLCYGLPVFFAIAGDSTLGKFNTIAIVSVFFALGNVTLAASSASDLHLPQIPFALVGLFLMALGTAGMKPCVAPFGGEQFELPEQRPQLKQFFSLFFFAVTIGNMVSTVVTPIFRRDVSCFGRESCYPLAFGVPACIMLIAILVFVSGKSLYKMKRPEENMILKVVPCIFHSLSKIGKGEKKTHWLDHSEKKYGKKLVTETKLLLRVLSLYATVPAFFALYEQLGSRWTLQAKRMNGKIGNFTIKPDQMQVSNAFLMFVFIPIFEWGVYPLFAKCKLLTRPLQRMCLGGLLAAASFLFASVIQSHIQAKPLGMVSLVECIRIENVTYNYGQHLIEKNKQFEINSCLGDKNWSGSIDADYFILFETNNSFNVTQVDFGDDSEDPLLRAVGEKNLTLFSTANNKTFTLDNYGSATVKPSTYLVMENEIELGQVEAVKGAHYILSNNHNNSKELEVSRPARVLMLWQLPQYIFMAWAEILFVVSGMEFSFTQAPLSMKSTLQSCWHLMNAIGNVIVILSAQLTLSQSTEFWIFALLMLIDTLVLMLLSWRYKYVIIEEEPSDQNGNS